MDTLADTDTHTSSNGHMRVSHISTPTPNTTTHTYRRYNDLDSVKALLKDHEVGVRVYACMCVSASGRW